MDARKAREWHMVLGTRDAESAAAELGRLVSRMDDAFDCLNYVLRLVAGSPDVDMEETLRVARTSTNEALEVLQKVAHEFRHHSDVA